MDPNRPIAGHLNELSARLPQRLSLPDQIESFIRELIVTGKLLPGERILETRIAKELRISQPTVREALAALQQEGLIVREQNRGCSVVKLSPLQVDQIFEVRMEWEPLAAILGMRRWTDQKREALLRPLAGMQAAAERNAVREYYQIDLQFHQAVWRSAENPYLEKALYQITMPLFAFVLIQLSAHQVLDLTANAGEHDRIAEAIFSQDPERAGCEIRRSMQTFWTWTREVMARPGEAKAASPRDGGK